MKRMLALMLAVILMLSCAAAARAHDCHDVDDTPNRADKCTRPDYIRGMDVSSVLSLEKAGVRYADSAGVERDLFALLAKSGVNTIRVRVWNDPYDSTGHGYGGGNCDVKNAAEIGRRAARYGLRLMVDFQYSDFWADPAKQQSPKAWEGLSIDERCKKVYEFTFASLKEIAAEGGKISVVQIGNETNNGIAGVSDRSRMMRIYQNGAKAVRDFDPAVRVAVHYTDPQQTAAICWLADELAENRIDYDVFAVSYYPYWHGSRENLKAVLDYVAETYDKDVMVAETSYAYSLGDSDGHPNTVAPGVNDSGEDLYDHFCERHQAQMVREILSTVSAVSGDHGLGVCYWEGAWISVGDTSCLSGEAYEAQVTKNRELWERYGCGWASSYAGEYDPDDAGHWYGGSAVDNQCFFAPDGRALGSLGVFMDIVKGRATLLRGDADDDGEVSILDATAVQRVLVGYECKTYLAEAADTDCDDEVTILDATEIQRYLVKYEVKGVVNEEMALYPLR